MSANDQSTFRPALVVVDFQEDFCPPNGTIPVTGGRDIAGAINELMDLPFTTRVATQDWHPQDHISFASNHESPNNKPFETLLSIKNPHNNSEAQEIRLWPDHCVQETFGAQLLPEFHSSKADLIIKKGQDARVEMYSAFRDTFTAPRVSESSLLAALKNASITHVFVTGLAMDYCVKHTALHAAEDGFKTFIISEATKAADQSEDALEALTKLLHSSGISIVDLAGPEIESVRKLAAVHT